MRNLLWAAVLVVGCGSCGGAEPAPPETLETPGEAMAREHAHDTPGPSAAVEPAPRLPVEGAELEYLPGVRGYLAQPTEGDPVAGLIVIHEWWGLNDNIRAMTRRLAGEGYVALAVDLYGGRSATDPAGARALMEAANADEPAAIRNLTGAAQALTQRGLRKLGVIGWCFGGGWALKTGLDPSIPIDAVVMYYGHPVLDRARLSNLRAPLLGLFGADDTGIPIADVRTMEATLRELGKNVTIQVYDGAGHAFANPSGGRYVAAAAEDSWRRTTEHFATHLRATP
jgi:carboxymethylenebutenolidase